MILFTMLPPFYSGGFEGMEDIPRIDLDEQLLQRTLVRKHMSKGEETSTVLGTYAPDYVRVKMLSSLCRVDGDVIYTGRLFFSDSVLAELKVMSEVDENISVFGLIRDPEGLELDIPDDAVREYECIQRVATAMELCGGTVVDSIEEIPTPDGDELADIDEVIQMMDNMKGEVDEMETTNETALEKALRQARERIVANGGAAAEPPAANKKMTPKAAQSATKKPDVTETPTQGKAVKKSLAKNNEATEKQPELPAEPAPAVRVTAGVDKELMLTLRLDTDEEYDITAEVSGVNAITVRLMPKNVVFSTQVRESVQPERKAIQSVKTPKTVTSGNEEAPADLIAQKAELDEQIRQARADGDDDTVNELRKERRKLREKIKAAGGSADE